VVSAGQIDIDPESLATAGSGLARIAERMAESAEQLENAVTGSGNPWGADETGTLFSGVYTVVLTQAMDALGSYVEQVGYAAMSLTLQARELVETDTSAAGKVNDAGSGL
jgi:hypothetical protein